MIFVLIVGLGGFIGTLLRFAIATGLEQTTFFIPLPTLIVNLMGSLIIGVLLSIGELRLGSMWFYFLVPGLLAVLQPIPLFQGI